ncbi:MAG: hypothetical protein JWN23_1840 [Rhodocyclales bacterium]|nr:hypothetical protein [Rhodocyclales bacterium]
MARGRYYMARVIKIGELNQERLQNAILEAPIVPIGKFEWTITDVEDGRSSSHPFIFGNLSKYSRDGHVTVIDEPAKQQQQALAPNLLEASAPFVYLPEFSGLAYMHVWNGIQEEVFPRRFKSIIESAYDNFFVDCTVEPIADYRMFYQRLHSLDRIVELSARVFPPNPLFGRLWSSLDQYIKKRGAEEVSVKEATEKKDGLNTKLVELIERILENPRYQPEEEPDIADAAMLMAADGYGSGKAIGMEHGEEVIVRTSESQKSFLYAKQPDPVGLANAARLIFENVSAERNMRH